MPDVQAASTFLSTLNEIHPCNSFTRELEESGKLPFLRMYIIRNSTWLERKVYRKPTDTGLLLYHHSHVDMKPKHSPFQTMLNRAFKLSSNLHFFSSRMRTLKGDILSLHYPEPLILNTITFFVEIMVTGSTRRPQQPFKDLRSTKQTRRTT